MAPFLYPVHHIALKDGNKDEETDGHKKCPPQTACELDSQIIYHHAQRKLDGPTDNKLPIHNGGKGNTYF